MKLYHNIIWYPLIYKIQVLSPKACTKVISDWPQMTQFLRLIHILSTSFKLNNYILLYPTITKMQVLSPKACTKVISDEVKGQASKFVGEITFNSHFEYTNETLL